MKKMRKLLSLVLVLTMVMAMSMTAFADDDTTTTTTVGSITVKNPISSTTKYTAYKIFDLTYNSSGAYSYTISSSSAWFSVVQGYISNKTATDEVGNSTNSSGLTLTESAAGGTYVVTVGDAFSAADFAAYLLKNIPTSFDSSDYSVTLTYNEESDTASANVSYLGYYLITNDHNASPNLAVLTSTDTTAEVYDKEAFPQFNKTATTADDTTVDDENSSTEGVEDSAGVQVGSTVTYTITEIVPSTSGYTSYTFQITDKMSTGLTFNKDVKVTLTDSGGTVYTIYSGTTGEITSGFEDICTVSYTNSSYDFVLTVDVMKLNEMDYVGATLTVTYTATVNSDAVSVISENKATLTYSNDPNDSTSTDTKEDDEKVYSSEIKIYKYAANSENSEDTSSPLSGAEFVLYKVVEGTDEDGNTTSTTYYYQWDDTDSDNPVVKWVTSIDDATVITTDTNGYGTDTFKGLSDGTYYLLEIAAPDGYNLLTDAVEITLSGSNVTTSNETTTDEDGNETTTTTTTVAAVTSNVANSAGTELPETGGMGTTILYAVGLVLILGAGIVLVSRKRMTK